MQPIDPSLAPSAPTSRQALPEPTTAPEERHWTAALVTIFAYVGWPVAIWVAYLGWKASDNPFKGPFWNGGTDLMILLWVTSSVFATVVSIAFGDFERLFRHLFRRSQR